MQGSIIWQFKQQYKVRDWLSLIPYSCFHIFFNKILVDHAKASQWAWAARPIRARWRSRKANRWSQRIEDQSVLEKLSQEYLHPNFGVSRGVRTEKRLRNLCRNTRAILGKKCRIANFDASVTESELVHCQRQQKAFIGEYFKQNFTQFQNQKETLPSQSHRHPPKCQHNGS